MPCEMECFSISRLTSPLISSVDRKLPRAIHRFTRSAYCVQISVAESESESETKHVQISVAESESESETKHVQISVTEGTPR